MRFLRFRIKNFKGIENATIDLTPRGAGIFTLIGLNESGKTTILEAISSFNFAKDDTQALYSDEKQQVDPAAYVPKHLKYNFSGEILIAATVALDEADRECIIKVAEAAGFIIEPASIPKEFEFRRGYLFENSDYVRRLNYMMVQFKGHEKRSRKNKPLPAPSPAWTAIYTALVKRMPQIVYFPTFLFDQPDGVVLNPGEDEKIINRVYRQTLENVAARLKNPLDLQKHVVDRLTVKEGVADQIIALMTLAPDKRQQIDHAINSLSAELTGTIFTSWSKIFGGNFRGREIVLAPSVEEDANGKPLVNLKIGIKDGITPYDISERSLGFRWFFSFLLFTIYRVSDERPVLFLLDEPASNLHSRAQMQLVESLPKIASDQNLIIYSTHSHYMVEPEWLDQAYIVSNSAIDYDDVTDKMMDGDRHTTVSVERYRNFVGLHPDRTTYFQPVLDKLEFTLSKLDILKKSVLVEGKGDYLILSYGRLLIDANPSEFAIVPTRGADGLDDIVGLFLGWGVPFVICLDDDKAGRAARDRYKRDWGLPEAAVFTLADVESQLANKAIEGFLEPADLALISAHFEIGNMPPSKSQIRLFFSELLAKRNKAALSPAFKKRIRNFVTVAERSFEGLAPTEAVKKAQRGQPVKRRRAK